MDLVVGIRLEVRVRDTDEPAPFGGQPTPQSLWFREHGRVEGKVSLAERVFDVNPHRIEGHAVPIEIAIEALHLRLTPNIPVALVVAERPQRRERRSARACGQLRKHVPRRWATEEDDLHRAPLTQPV